MTHSQPSPSMHVTGLAMHNRRRNSELGVSISSTNRYSIRPPISGQFTRIVVFEITLESFLPFVRVSDTVVNCSISRKENTRNVSPTKSNEAVKKWGHCTCQLCFDCILRHYNTHHKGTKKDEIRKKIGLFSLVKL